jgi:threonine dehydrogenase-like Zn-dependent dehydrogenase
MPHELLLAAPRSLELVSYDEGPLAPDELRAEALVSGISHGTELALYRGVSPFAGKRFDTGLRLFVEDERASYPMRLGYEWVGRVVETGAETAEPVAGELVHLALPHRETHTLRLEDRRHPALTRLPGGLDPERGTLLSSAAIALQAIHDARVKAGDAVAVFGLGAFGLLAVQLARLSGAGWIAAVDPSEGRRALAQRFGADAMVDPSAADAGRALKTATDGGVDVAIEFSGRYSALHDALRGARLAATVVAAGFYVGGAGDDLRLGEEWHHNRLTLVSSMSGWGAPHRDAGWDRPRLRATALELLADGRLESDALVTHRFPFTQAGDAYDLIDRSADATVRTLLQYRVPG